MASLPGLAAIGLALGIGIGLGVWLGERVESGGAPPADVAAPRPAAPAQPRVTLAPWVPEPQIAPLPRLDEPSLPREPAPAVVPPSPPAEALPAWRRHAVPAPAVGGRAMIAVVIDDMGVDQRHSALAVELPGPLTLAYLPYARDLARQTGAARARGHELLVHLPMQPQGGTGAYDDPGPNALLVGQPAEEIRRRVALALASFDGYVGVNNHMGSRFTADAAAMSAVMTELKARGLLFLDSRTTAASRGAAAAEAAGVPHVGRHVFLDNDQSAGELAARLAEVERIARTRGAAVAIGHPHPTTIAGLRDWLPRLAEKGLVLVPLTAVVARAEEGRPPATAP